MLKCRICGEYNCKKHSILLGKSVSLKEIPNLKKYKNNFEAHLMCYHPEKYIKKLKQKGFKKIIFRIHGWQFIFRFFGWRIGQISTTNQKTTCRRGFLARLQFRPHSCDNRNGGFGVYGRVL